MKFLITNSVPLNGGDEALLRSLVLSLSSRWPDSEINILCKDLELCRQYLPDLRFNSDLEFAKTEESRRATIECYRTTDIVLSAPGGFLHDHYPVEQRLRGFELALKLSKPVVLVGQSIGPFWKRKSIKRVRHVLNRVSCICVRDEISRRYLLECGVDSSKIRVTADVAFLWHRLLPGLFQPKMPASARTIGLSFRAWPLRDQKTLHNTIAKAERLCLHLLADSERRILFLSTCQGIPGYIDDSLVAGQIRDRLPEHLQLRCEIDQRRYRPAELIQALAHCDAFIGMRLHSCILAMLAGVPAMGLGYEDKTEQIFGQMGLDSYQIRFDTDSHQWTQSAERFLSNLGGIRDHLASALADRCESADRNITAIGEELLTVAVATGATPQARWSEAVKRYGRPHLRLRQVAALVNSLKPKRMLDVGCATGHLRMLCPGVEYTGVDFIAPSSPVDFSFRQCNFNRESLPAELNGFDVVVCSGILEYIDDMPLFLTSLRSVLAPAGYLVLTYFNMNHISRIKALMRGRSFPVHPDWRGFCSPEHIRTLVEKSGFEIDRTVVTSHSFREALNVEGTVSTPMRLPKAHWWSKLLAHQFLFVAKDISQADIRKMVNSRPHRNESASQRTQDLFTPIYDSPDKSSLELNR